MVRDLLNRLIDGQSLTADEAADLMGRMMDEDLTAVQLSGVMVALRSKGETADEIIGFARTMRDRARQIEIEVPVADTCGTGGDGSGTFNVSTAAALIVAACGQPVAKHGNRGASSRCGSADVLEALGVDVALPPAGVARCIQEAKIGFLFAPAFHPAMKFAAVPRRELGVRTVFNLLGPLTNPARPRYQLLGVSNAALLDLMAQALLGLGVESALVVHSRDGTDEISISSATMVREVRSGSVRAYDVTPEEFGVTRAPVDAIRGGDAAENAGILRRILAGDRNPARDAAVINAAAALYACGAAPTLRDGARLAAEAIDSRRAAHTLDTLRLVSQGARQAIESAA
ncbi:MAG: anthranilate phosphoribosyltransferase [Chloroflexota bacterium]|nr:anthranilate phosphoribosyltransferase [Chloroflexota bacterium]